MRARIVMLGVLLGASSARAQATPAPGEAFPPAPVPPEAAPASAPDAPASSGAPEAPPEGVTAAPEARAAEMSTADAAALSGEMTEAELLELGLGTNQPAVDTSVRLSGFMDFGMVVGLNDIAKSGNVNDRSFAIGNLNLYITKNITETVRTMAEIRFLYLPNGATNGALGATTNYTTTADYADFQRTLHWGGVEIERVYLEWAASRYLTIRGGQFLTPYGVWNVDHGTPTIIPAAKPYVIGIGFFPERQTGLELYGRTEIGSYSDFGYHLTLSNGTGLANEWQDLDKNKAVGGRAFWEYRRFGELRVGGSAYYGRNTDGVRQLNYSNGNLGTVVNVNSQSDVLALALDTVWKYRGFHLQWEWVSAQRKYTTKGRTGTPAATGGTAFPVDAFNWGTYALAGYRFEWFGVMPFVMYQYFTQQDNFDDKGWSFGLNIRPIDALAIKVQYDNEKLNFNSQRFKDLYFQAAWAF